MRKKQLFALLMAGALSVGMAPTATFAADTAAETSAEGELEGELDSADTEEPSEIRLKLLGTSRRSSRDSGDPVSKNSCRNNS